MPTGDNILRLSELSAIVAGVFQHHFAAERFWVTAEITGMRLSRGHCYLQLAEKDENGTTPKAEFRGNIWSFQYERLSQRFFRMTGSPLKENLEVLLCVEVKYHERYGLSLIIHDIDPAYTMGRMEMEKRQTLERLRKEGHIDRNRHLPLPRVPQRIALISAEDTRGYEDFMNRITNHPGNYRFEVTLYNSLLQGDLAAGDIIAQLNRISTEMVSAGYDMVALVRGGGAVSGMECFNNYNLAVAIATFPLPVITGIGHHADNSVADAVAALHRMTPTDVANFFVEQATAFEAEINGCGIALMELSREILLQQSEDTTRAIHRLKQSVAGRLTVSLRRMDQAAYGLRHNLQGRMLGEKHALTFSKEKLKREARMQPQLERAAFDMTAEKLRSALSAFMKAEGNRLQNKEDHIRLLDPLVILRRGYSYTLKDGNLVTRAEQVSKGDIINTVFAEGRIISEVK